MRTILRGAACTGPGRWCSGSASGARCDVPDPFDPREESMRKFLIPTLLAAVALIPVGGTHAVATGAYGSRTAKVTVPDSDRFTPFAKTIHVGDTVAWMNNDTDNHTVVSDDKFNTAGNQGIDQLLPSGGTFELTFTQPGMYV